ncbi:response regulator transcription factor [Mangrovibacillus cuniculi]|uniref:Response regulator transcription factor n=1 Tax=Mangrovibacillus cuniculi TaxID=2593652 RepID=A0A7S8HEL8_9BACI|nr:response regulator transcription factor [Mangrovibacillus cuniculi]QPC45847.1 response regulator transcription factor [Mangrovibacillus cuniculi]
MTSILIVDDHHVVRQGLRFFLQTQEDFRIVGEAENGQEAVGKVKELQPDIVLMDLMMPVLDGIGATKVIKESFPSVKVMVLTSFSEYDQVIPAMEAGANGYQLKDIEPDDLVTAIRKMVKGENSIHQKATDQLVNRMTNIDKQSVLFNRLTTREKDVLLEMAEGKSNKEIADALFISEKTVKTHVSHLLNKLEVSDRTQAALLAVKYNLHQKHVRSE